MEPELPPGTELRRDATAGIRYPLTISRVHGITIIGNRRIEAFEAGAAIAGLFIVVWAATSWYPWAVEKIGGWSVILSVVVSVFAVPLLLVALVRKLGLTARTFPTFWAQLTSWLSRYSELNKHKRATTYRPSRLRSASPTCFVAPRKDKP